MDFNSLPHASERLPDNVVVIDVAMGTTSEEAARLMNEPYGRGYYIHRTLECREGTRVIYVRRVKPLTPTGTTKESQAMQFLRDNREMSTAQLVAAFKAIGFVRGAQWITTKRLEVIRSERKA